jgi:putative copper export protein
MCLWTRIRPTTIKLVKVAFWVLVVLTTLERFGRNAFDLAAGIACLLAAAALNEHAKTRADILRLQIILVIFGLALAGHGADGLGWLGKVDPYAEPPSGMP